MELVPELFVTAFVALVFSFVVAKLVSIAMAGGADERRSASGSTASEIAGTEKVTEEVKFGGGLRVRSTETERRVRFVEEAVENVDEFVGERSRFGEEIEEKMRDSAGEEVSDVTGLQEKSPEFEAELISGGEIGGTEEERSEGTQGDVFNGVEDKIVVADLIVEEKIVENVIVVGGSVRSDVVVVPHGEAVRDSASGKNQAIGIEEGLNQGDEEKEGLVDAAAAADDDWVGIEKSELEEVFAEAANFAAHRDTDDRLSNIGSDVRMQLYGLRKVAMEGPCREPAPMALKVSARAKWNAWQRLGNKSPEVAMEQYITLLSDKVPGWMEGKSSGDGTAESADPLEPQISEPPYPTTSTYPDNQLDSTKGREMELKVGTDGGNPTACFNSVNKE